MKALFSVALVCALFSMSAFTVVKHRAHKNTVKTVPGWPITGTHGGYSYAIYGNGQVPGYIGFSNASGAWGPYTFTQQAGGGLYTASIPSTSPVFNSITSVDLGIYTNQDGYVLTWHPDFSFSF